MTAMPPDDRPICPAGEPPGTFAAFYQATVARTLGVARRVATAGDEQVARDATQDAYVEMYRRWSERQARSFDDNRRYVVGIAVHKVVDWYRRPTAIDLDHALGCGIEERGYIEVLDENRLFGAVRVDFDPVGDWQRWWPARATRRPPPSRPRQALVTLDMMPRSGRQAVRNRWSARS